MIKTKNKLANCKQEQVAEILELLAAAYPEAGTALLYTTPFELLVATILSAQCTDKQVNRVTDSLFKKFNTPRDFAALMPEELADEIKGCGLYRNKSKYIVAASQALLSRYDGLVPQSREELESLPGVGKKTAGVVSGLLYGSDALPVDTHVYRIAHRLGLSKAKNPDQVEKDLAAYIPAERRMAVHHHLLAHGRQVCLARKPACAICFLQPFCPYGAKEELFCT